MLVQRGRFVSEGSAKRLPLKTATDHEVHTWIRQARSTPPIRELLRAPRVGHAGVYLLFFAVDLALSAVAVLLERAELGLLRGPFVQRALSRQLLWVALVRSLWNALVGMAVGWGESVRTGAARAPPACP